jgi:hypothetical protein
MKRVLVKDWQKVFLRATGVAARVTLALVGVGLSIYWYSSRPKAWDTHALIVRHAKAEGLSRLNDKFDEISSGSTFTVDVENTTGADISLPQTLTIMGQTRASHALHGSFLKLAREYFLPARHVTTISLEVDDQRAANDPPQSCFDRYFKEDEDIVIFDDAQKYEILIPVPPLTLPSSPTKTGSSEMPAPPCKNGAATCEPWQRDWSKGDLKPGSVVTKQGTIVQPSGR